jgi:hypothetical protein
VAGLRKDRLAEGRDPVKAYAIALYRHLKAQGELQRFLALLHLGIAWSTHHRPNMTELVPAYWQFNQIASTPQWGWTALAIGLGLLLLPRANPLLIVWQTFSAIFFFLFALLVTGGNGLTFGTVIYGGLTLASARVAYRTAVIHFAHTRSPERLRAWLHRWRHG